MKPGHQTIPYARQSVSRQDIAEVVRVLKSPWLTQGPAIPAFEEAVTARVGAAHAVAVSNATAALHIGCLALGLGPGDRLWTTPISFVASANCGLYCGAEVDFVDIDPLTGNLSPDALETKLKAATRAGTLPKIVVPVHLAGQSCDMAQISALAKKYGFRVIEDASHAIGGRYQETPIGSCRYSDLTIFSFHPVKIITTGEGGMLTTNDPALDRRLRLLRSHGITREPDCFTRPAPGDWYYEQQELGFNYRMTDIQATLGASQLRRLDRFIGRRHAIAARYDRALKRLPIVIPPRDSESASACHLYIIRVPETTEPGRRKRVFDFLRRQGIHVNVHYLPIPSHPYYQRLGFKPGDFPEAERFSREAISLPMFYDLRRADQDFVIRTLTAALA